MTIAELKKKLGERFAQRHWQIIDFGAKNAYVSPVEYSWINMYQLKPEPRFNIFFHEQDDGNICVEVHFDKSFLFIASLSNTVDVAKATWRNSEYYREYLDVEVTDIINIIFTIN